MKQLAANILLLWAVCQVPFLAFAQNSSTSTTTSASSSSVLLSPRDFIPNDRGQVFVISEGQVSACSSKQVAAITVSLIQSVAPSSMNGSSIINGLLWNVNICANSTSNGISYSSATYDSYSETLYIAYKTVNLVNSVTSIRAITKSGSLTFPFISFNTTVVYPSVIASNGADGSIYLLSQMSLIRIFQSSSVSSSSNGTSRSNNVITIHTFSPQYIATDIKIDQGFAFISGVYKSSSSVSGFFFDQISLNPAATTSIPLEHIVSDAQGMGLFSQSVWSIGSRKSPSMFKSSIVVCSGKVYFLLNAVAANATSPNGFGLAAYVYDATTFQQLSSSNATLVPNYDSVVSATCLDSSNIVKSSTLSTYPNQGILLLVSQVGVTVPTTPATSPNTGNDGGTGTDTALDSSSTTSVIRPEYLLFVNSSLSPSIKYQIPNAVLTSTDPSMDILMLSVQSLYNQPNISALMFAFADNQAANSSSLSTSPLLGGVYETFSFSTSIPFQSFYPSVNNCNDGYFYDNSTSQCISCTAPSRAGDVANYPSCQSYLVNPTYGASGSASSSKLAAAIIIPLMIAVVVGLYLVYLKYKAVIDPLLPSWMTSSTSREWGSPATAAAAPTMSKRNYIGGGGVGGGRGIPGNREEFADLEKAERFGQHGNDHDVGKENESTKMLLPGFSVIDKGGVVFQNTNTARNSNALNPSGKKTSSSSRASSFIASIFKPGGNQEGISQQQQQPQLVISNPVLVSSSAMNRTSPFQHFISGPRPQPNQPAITVTAASTCAHFAAHSPATTTETKKSLYTTTINAARSDSKLLNENEGKAALSNWATSNPINPAPTPTTTTTTITPEKDLISMGPATPIVSVYQPDLSSFARQYLSDKYTEAAKKQAAEAAEAGKGAMSSQELENLINSLRAKEDGGADVKSSNSASIHLSSWSPARAEKSETLIAQAASTRSILNPSGGAGGGMKKSVSIENLASEKKKSWAVAAAKSNNNITGVDSRVAGITTNTVSRSAGHSRSRSCEQKPPKAPPTPKKEQQQAAPTPSDLDSASSAAQRMEHLLSLARRGEAESTSTSTDSSNGILNLIDGY